ncbi:hypothetical protein H1C71_034994, partial [Ictidomys tridecemlineatus]
GQSPWATVEVSTEHCPAQRPPGGQFSLCFPICAKGTDAGHGQCSLPCPWRPQHSQASHDSSVAPPGQPCECCRGSLGLCPLVTGSVCTASPRRGAEAAV